MKKGFFIGVVLFVLIFIAMLYLDVIRFNKETGSPFDVIPTDAALIISSDNINAARKKIASTRFEPAFMLVPPTRLLDDYLDFFDSLLLAGGNNEQPHSLFSLHVTGAKTFDFLCVWDYNDVGEININKVLKKVPPAAAVIKRSFENIEIYEIHFNDKASSFTFCYQKGFFIGSYTPFLVEYAVIQLNSKQSVLKNPYFGKISALSGKNYDLTVYLNYPGFSKYLSVYANESAEEMIGFLSDFAEWSELDIIFKEKAVYLNGYTICNDSAGQFLKKFNGIPKKNTIGSIAPDNTAVMIHYNVDGMADYINKEKTESFPERLFKGEWSYLIVEPYDLNIKNASFLCVKISDSEGFKEFISNSEKNILGENVYKDYTFYRIRGIDSLDFLGRFNKHFQDVYYTFIQDYAVFSPSQNGLQSFVDKFMKQEILDKNFNYVSFLENLVSNSNINVYVNTQMIANILLSSVSQENSQILQDNMKTYRKVAPVAFQFSFQKDIFFTNGYMSYVEEEFSKNNLLWSVGLESCLRGEIFIVKNHYTGENEMILQDENNVLYLLSKGGNILWKRQIDGPIVSKIFQMDFYDNGKFQYFFNSRDKIYLIDRNAEDVEGYPLRLNDPASNGVFLVDYDGNKKYRYFIASENGNIYGYEQTGKPLPGWNPKKDIGEVKQAVKHFLVNGKDYLLINNTSGTLYLFDRRGDARVAAIKLNTHFQNEWYLDKTGKEYKLINTDTSNYLYKISLSGITNSYKISEADNKISFKVLDINQDETNEYIIIKDNQLIVCKNNLDSTNFSQSVVFKYELASTARRSPDSFEAGRSEEDAFNVLSWTDIKGFGVCEKDKGYSYYFLPDGTLHPDFPFETVSSFTINDLYTDGSNIFIAGDKDARISAYKIE